MISMNREHGSHKSLEQVVNIYRVRSTLTVSFQVRLTVTDSATQEVVTTPRDTHGSPYYNTHFCSHLGVLYNKR